MKVVALVALLALSNPVRSEVAARGRVICLDGAGETAFEGCGHFGLRTPEGKVFKFLPDDTRAQIFTDPRVRERELEVKGWPRADDAATLEITKVFSIKDGRRYDIYYFCPVCNITSHTPGPCWCCRADFEFKEEPHKP